MTADDDPGMAYLELPAGMLSAIDQSLETGETRLTFVRQALLLAINARREMPAAVMTTRARTNSARPNTIASLRYCRRRIGRLPLEEWKSLSIGRSCEAGGLARS